MSRTKVWSSKCPACDSRHLRRSRLRGLLEWLVALLIVPYRCMDCHQRTFKFRFRVHEPARPAESHARV